MGTVGFHIEVQEYFLCAQSWSLHYSYEHSLFSILTTLTEYQQHDLTLPFKENIIQIQMVCV